MLLLCRTCLSNGALKELEWDLKQWNPLIQDRAFVPWLLQMPQDDELARARPITSTQIAALEDLWREDPTAKLEDLSKEGATDYADPVRQTYEDGFHYQNVLAPLIKAEAEEDKRIAEHIIRDQVSVAWDVRSMRPIARFTWAHSGERVEKMITGDEVKLKLAAMRSQIAQGLAWEGVGMVREATEQAVTLEMRSGSLLDENGQEIDMPPASNGMVLCPTDVHDGYTVQLMWKSVSFDRMQTALRNFALDEAAVSPYLYKALLGHMPEPPSMPPVSKRVLTVPGLPQLNPSQLLAVRTALQRPLALIQGPPGTGKTVTSAAIVYHLQQMRKGQVLVAAPSNVAVDQLTAKIAATGLKVIRVYSRAREAVDSDVIQHALHTMIADIATLPEKMAAEWDATLLQYRQEEAAAAANPNSDAAKAFAKRENPSMPGAPAAVQLLGKSHGVAFTRLHWLRQQYGELVADNERKYRNLVARAEEALLHAADVICCTCVGAGDRRLRYRKFKQVLIDEVTQASEAEVLIPVVKGAKQLVLVGDHCQLGPVVISKTAAAAGLHQSLFERLIMLGIRPLRLQVQYRMHPVLAEFPSNIFYEGSLQNGVTLAERTPAQSALQWPMPGRPMFFYMSTGAEEIAGSGTSYINRSEASAVERLVTNFLRAGVEPGQIGVITPYEGQRAYVIQHMARHGSLPSAQYAQVEVASVDSFQGREKDYTILSCVRSNEHQGIGFLNDPRRLNVALTRARYGMVVVGNPKVLAKQLLWNNLLHHFKQLNCLVEGPLNALRHSKMHFPWPRKFINPRYKLYTVGGEVHADEAGKEADTTTLEEMGAGMFPFSVDSTMAGYTAAMPAYGADPGAAAAWAAAGGAMPSEYTTASAAPTQQPTADSGHKAAPVAAVDDDDTQSVASQSVSVAGGRGGGRGKNGGR